MDNIDRLPLQQASPQTSSSIPGPRDSAPAQQQPTEQEAPNSPSEARFQCPNCLGWLATDLGNIQAHPAPCPHCGSGIFAPRVANITPFPGTHIPAVGQRQKHLRPDRKKAKFHFRPNKRG